MALSLGNLSDYVDILGNIASNMVPVQRLVTGCAYLLGIVLIMKGLMTLKEHGEQRTMMSQKTSIKEPLIYFIVGGMLLYGPSAFKTVMATLFGVDASIMAYGPLTRSGTPIANAFYNNSAAGAALVTIIQTIGIVAFVRGWVLIARAGAQGQAPGGMGKGFIHVLGGVLAINIVGTIDMINNTIYGT